MTRPYNYTLRFGPIHCTILCVQLRWGLLTNVHCALFSPSKSYYYYIVVWSNHVIEYKMKNERSTILNVRAHRSSRVSLRPITIHNFAIAFDKIKNG